MMHIMTVIIVCSRMPLNRPCRSSMSPCFNTPRRETSTWAPRRGSHDQALRPNRRSDCAGLSRRQCIRRRVERETPSVVDIAPAGRRSSPGRETHCRTAPETPSQDRTARRAAIVRPADLDLERYYLGAKIDKGDDAGRDRETTERIHRPSLIAGGGQPASGKSCREKDKRGERRGASDYLETQATPSCNR
jgi:hypothetical protein